MAKSGTSFLNGLLTACVLASGVPAGQAQQPAPTQTGASRRQPNTSSTKPTVIQESPEAVAALEEEIRKAYRDKKVELATEKNYPDLVREVDEIHRAIPKKIHGLEYIPPKPRIYVIDSPELKLAFTGRQNVVYGGGERSDKGTIGVILISTGMIDFYKNKREERKFGIAHEAAGHGVFAVNPHLKDAYVPPNEKGFLEDGKDTYAADSKRMWYEEAASDMNAVAVIGHERGMQGFFRTILALEKKNVEKEVGKRIEEHKKKTGKVPSDAEVKEIRKEIEEEKKADRRLSNLIVGDPHASHQYRLDHADETMQQARVQQKDLEQGKPWITRERLDRIMTRRGYEIVPESKIIAESADKIGTMTGIKRNTPVYLTRSGFIDKSNIQVERLMGQPFVIITPPSLRWDEKEAEKSAYRITQQEIEDGIKEGTIKRGYDPVSEQALQALRKRIKLQKPVTLYTSQEPNFPAIRAVRTKEGSYAIMLHTKQLAGILPEAIEAGIAQQLIQLRYGDMDNRGIAAAHNDNKAGFMQVERADKEAAGIVGQQALGDYLRHMYENTYVLIKQIDPSKTTEALQNEIINGMGIPSLEQRLAAIKGISKRVDALPEKRFPTGFSAMVVESRNHTGRER